MCGGWLSLDLLRGYGWSWSHAPRHAVCTPTFCWHQSFLRITVITPTPPPPAGIGTEAGTTSGCCLMMRALAMHPRTSGACSDTFFIHLGLNIHLKPCLASRTSGDGGGGLMEVVHERMPNTHPFVVSTDSPTHSPSLASHSTTTGTRSSYHTGAAWTSHMVPTPHMVQTITVCR